MLEPQNFQMLRPQLSSAVCLISTAILLGCTPGEGNESTHKVIVMRCMSVLLRI